jgi:hypothetical protein
MIKIIISVVILPSDKKSRIHWVKYHKKTLLTDSVYISAGYAIIRRYKSVDGIVSQSIVFFCDTYISESLIFIIINVSHKAYGKNVWFLFEDDKFSFSRLMY